MRNNMNINLVNGISTLMEQDAILCYLDIHDLKFVDQGYNWKLGH